MSEALVRETAGTAEGLKDQLDPFVEDPPQSCAQGGAYMPPLARVGKAFSWVPWTSVKAAEIRTWLQAQAQARARARARARAPSAPCPSALGPSKRHTASKYQRPSGSRTSVNSAPLATRAR
jgi:hypothetical protein